MGWADVYISSFIVFSSRSLSRGSTKHRFVAEWIVPAHATKRWCNFALQSADCSHLKKKKKKTKTKKKNKNVLGAKARVSLTLLKRTRKKRIIIMGWADVYISSFIVFSSRSLSRGSTKHRFVAEWIVPAHATKRWCNFALQSADCSHLKKKKKKTKTKKKNKNVLGAKARVSLPL